VTEESSENFISEKLQEILSKDKIQEVSVVSALNHFTLMPEGFSEHDLGFDLIAFNAPVDKENEELMLSVNKKFNVQFYYTFPKNFYTSIKAFNVPANFNFSGEKFLNTLNAKNQKEIHINLYHNQCEFFALDHKKVVLYNNLDVNSEVDFLYFIMFTLSKIGFGINETQFLVYGETTENETFISELRKFVKNLKIVFDNVPNKNFVFL
jgi:CRISPR/Cas system-associated protein Csx1